MRWFLVVCVAAALAGVACADCDACLYGVCYTKHVLPAFTAGSSGDIDRNTNTLYVTSYPSEDKIKQCNLDTQTCNEYSVRDIRTIVVDQRNGDIYGNSYWRKGIYKYDLPSGEEHLVVSNYATWNIFFKNKLYFAASEGGIYTYENGVTRIVSGTQGYNVVSLVVDKNNDMYFTYLPSGRSYNRRLTNGVVYREDFLDTIAFVTLDNEGNAVFINHTYPHPKPIAATHVYRKINGEVVEIGALNDWPYGEPLFDRDNNLVYSFSSIQPYVHLKKNSGVLCKVESNTIKVRSRTSS